MKGTVVACIEKAVSYRRGQRQPGILRGCMSHLLRDQPTKPLWHWATSYWPFNASYSHRDLLYGLEDDPGTLPLLSKGVDWASKPAKDCNKAWHDTQYPVQYCCMGGFDNSALMYKQRSGLFNFWAERSLECLIRILKTNEALIIFLSRLS